jgi:hypothetical protein
MVLVFRQVLAGDTFIRFDSIRRHTSSDSAIGHQSGFGMETTPSPYQVTSLLPDHYAARRRFPQGASMRRSGGNVLAEVDLFVVKIGRTPPRKVPIRR